MTAVLSHRGSALMTRDQLRVLPTAEPMGARHRPVPHIEIVETVHRVLDEFGFDITNEKFAVGAKGDEIFGTLELKGQGTKWSREFNCDEYCPTLGFRSSNIQRFPVAMVSGISVFVCDNLAFFGEFQVLNKRHTLNLNLLDEVRYGINRFIDEAIRNREEIHLLKERELEDREAKCFVFDVFKEGIFPIKLFDNVVDEYWRDVPRHLEFAPRTAWSLTNAFTEVAKSLNPTPRTAALSKLGVAQKRLLM